MCQVKTFELYQNRLNPENEYLWQKRKRKNYFGSTLVYKGAPKQKQDWWTYDITNHRVRATCVTVLDDKGYEATHISSHKKNSPVTG